MQSINIEQIKKIQDIHQRNEIYFGELHESQELYLAHNAVNQYCHAHRGILLATILQFWSKLESIDLLPFIKKVKQWTKESTSDWEKETLPQILSILNELQTYKQSEEHSST